MLRMGHPYFIACYVRALCARVEQRESATYIPELKRLIKTSVVRVTMIIYVRTQVYSAVVFDTRSIVLYMVS